MKTRKILLVLVLILALVTTLANFGLWLFPPVLATIPLVKLVFTPLGILVLLLTAFFFGRQSRKP